MASETVALRITCYNPPDGNFGLQDKQKNLKQGISLHDNQLAFDFELKVKQTGDGSPNFTGTYAHGTVQKRFVYLTLKDNNEKIIKRIKIQLATIQWEQVKAVMVNPESRFQAHVDGRGSATVPLLGDGWTIE